MTHVEHLLVDGQLVTVHRKAIKNMYLRVGADGQPTVSSPLRQSTARIEHFVRERRTWIESQQQRRRTQTTLSPSSGQHAALRARIQPYLEHWQRQLDVNVATLTVRAMKTRWGSCQTVSRRITVNLALAELDDDLLEYVIVHELVHLHEPNHGPRFHAMVATCLPDWKERRSRLRHYRLA